MGVLILNINTNYINDSLSKLTNSSNGLTTSGKPSTKSNTPNSVNFSELAMLMMNQLNQPTDSQSSEDDSDNIDNGIDVQNTSADTSSLLNSLLGELQNSTSQINNNGLSSTTLSNFTNDAMQTALTNLTPNSDETSDSNDFGLPSFLPNTNTGITSLLSDFTNSDSVSKSSISNIINSAYTSSKSKEDFLNLLKKNLTIS